MYVNVVNIFDTFMFYFTNTNTYVCELVDVYGSSR